MDEKRTYAVAVVVTVLSLLLPCLYSGSYLAFLSDRGIIQQDEESRMMRRLPYYEPDIPFAAEFFRPANWIDRRIRPDYWRWDQEDEDYPF